MKKLLLATTFAVASFSASAVEVGVAGAYDHRLAKWGERVELRVADSWWGVKPTASVTYLKDDYTRYAIGGAFPLVKLGKAETFLTGSGVYQDTRHGTSGYGLTVGLRAEYLTMKNLAVTGAVEHFQGQDRLSIFNGTTAAAGVAFRF